MANHAVAPGVLVTGVMVVLSLTLGLWVGTRREMWAALQERAEWLECEQRARAEQARVEERTSSTSLAPSTSRYGTNLRRPRCPAPPAAVSALSAYENGRPCSPEPSASYSRHPAARHRLADLTPRERDVITAVSEGLSNTEIGRQLRLREATVKAHVSRALAKLGLNNRVQAAILVRDAQG